MKLSEQEIREIIQEELKNISEQDPAKQQAAPKKKIQLVQGLWK